MYTKVNRMLQHFDGEASTPRLRELSFNSLKKTVVALPFLHAVLFNFIYFYLVLFILMWCD